MAACITGHVLYWACIILGMYTGGGGVGVTWVSLHELLLLSVSIADILAKHMQWVCCGSELYHKLLV